MSISPSPLPSLIFHSLLEWTLRKQWNKLGPANEALWLWIVNSSNSKTESVALRGLGRQVGSSPSLVTSKTEIIAASLLNHGVAEKSQWVLTVGLGSWDTTGLTRCSGGSRCLCPSVLLQEAREQPADPWMLTGKSWNEAGKDKDLAKMSPV